MLVCPVQRGRETGYLEMARTHKLLDADSPHWRGPRANLPPPLQIPYRGLLAKNNISKLGSFKLIGWQTTFFYGGIQAQS